MKCFAQAPPIYEQRLGGFESEWFVVIPSMSSEETCLQGFPNDDIFGVIAFALVQIKAVGLRKMRTITVER